MPIDKSWMQIKDRLSVRFQKGLKEFIDQAKNYANSVGQISCPCKKCLNQYMHMPNVVYGHIFTKGIDQTYTTWHLHGESFPSGYKYRHSTSQNESSGDRHGRISMLEHMERSLDPVTQQPRPIIENWENLHTNPDGTWTHESAQRKAAVLRERVTQASSSGAAINEAAIVEEVLGRSRGFRTGIGPTLTRSSTSEPSVGISQGTSQTVTENLIARAEKSEAMAKKSNAMAKKSNARAKKSEAQVRKLLAFITEQFPGASMPVTPPVSDDSDDADDAADQ